MDQKEIEIILVKAKKIFKEEFLSSHIENTKKLTKLSKFNYNPLLLPYIANFLTGNENSESLAKALLYPRILGTSLNTIFGNFIQNFCLEIKDSIGEHGDGLDISFFDHKDQCKKYWQIKSGPNILNHPDVQPIIRKFSDLINRSRLNRGDITQQNIAVGVIYGTEKEMNGPLKTLKKEVFVYIGQDFWHRLTGDPKFYHKLSLSFGEVAKEVDCTEIIDDLIKELGKDIEFNYKRE